MSNISSGLLAAVPLAVVFTIHALVRNKALVAFFRGTGPEASTAPSLTIFLIILACLVAVAFLFGLVAGLIHGRMGLPSFRALAFGAALAFTLLAVITRTPLLGDKIFWNLAVGGLLGWLVPVFAA
ncbi:MAG: hypothetical protein JXB85_16870 [Anaerolineales bacterium]|nr:hypothetical protein [Anaerolineales bacterium]